MNLIKHILLLKNWLLNRHGKISYSQEGEDLILARIFEGQRQGFYIDVGAHHPLRFSNTYLLYLNGWTGINIDATPGSMDAFRLLRSRDINLEMAIGRKKESKTYYLFDEPALNTFDKKLIKPNQKHGYQLIGQQEIELLPLSTVINKYANNQIIDLLTIDVEGMDYQVLESMDWAHQIKVVVIEQLSTDLKKLSTTPSHKLLTKKGYSLFAKTVNSAIYLHK